MKKRKQKRKQKNVELSEIIDNKFDDNYLADNIVKARDNHEKACEIYRNYVGSSETREEKLRRINLFRCGGWE